MAISSPAAPATTAAIASDTASNTSETIVGSHIFRIDGFSATKHLGVGKCIKSSTFRVGGHGWYIDCYPCGDVEERAGWVTLFLRREDDDHGSRLSGYCEFTLMESLKDGSLKKVSGHPSKQSTLAGEDRHSLLGTDLVKREELEWILDDDCFHVRCVVFVQKFPAAPPPDMPTETMATGSHVLTVDGDYSKTRRAFVIGEAIESGKFRVGGHTWCFYFCPCGQDEYNVDDRVSVALFLDDPDSDDGVKVRVEIILLTRAGQIISSGQDYGTFSERNNGFLSDFHFMMEHESSPLLQDGIQIRCDIAVVDGIMATPNLRRGIQGIQHVRGDVTFEAGGHLFEAHKCVLTTRCTAFFMAEFFEPPMSEKAGGTYNVRVDMKPRVFEALLHFIYTDALPEVYEEGEGKVVVAQGLLVAADRYAMEKLKLICSELLCSYINDPGIALTTLDLADKYACPRLKEACMKFLMEYHGAKAFTP